MRHDRTEQYLQAHVVDDGFPPCAKEYQASVHALGLPIWALVKEIYAAVLLLLQPAHHRQLMYKNRGATITYCLQQSYQHVPHT